jgi:urocanate hydratase
MAASIQSEHQLNTLRLYGALIDQREDWGGKLVLGCGTNCAASGIPPAVSIAGGACLVIEADATAVKAAMRLGELDFVVNTLDEALRTLKNEIRKHRPLSVGLIADVDSALNEVVERGLQPDLLLIAANQPGQPILQNASIRALQASGLAVRQRTGAEDEAPGEPWPRRKNAVYRPAANPAELKAIDDRLLTILPPGDLVRRRWIRQVPKYLREARSGGRWIWLSKEEEEQLGA